MSARRCRRSTAWAAPLVVTVAFVIAGCGTTATCSGRGAVPGGNGSAVEQPISVSSPGVAALALRYEPTVMMSKRDRFWPVSLATVLKERDRYGAGVSLVSRGRTIDPATLGSLKRTGDSKAYLSYPAGLASKVDQMRAFLRGLGLSESAIAAWPNDSSAIAAAAKRSGQIYFYDAGTGCSYAGHATVHYRALEYWFFYGLNYYPMTVDTQTMLAHPLEADTADTDFHEGDWEHVTVLLDQERSGYVPKFVWMARHSGEGVLIPWDQVERDRAGHPVVYPAFGGHPSYPSCGAHGRAILAAAVYDYVVCGEGLYSFRGASTALVDLAHVGWSCWPGYFGTTVGTTGSGNGDDPTGAILVAGPRSPLRQGENQHVCR